MTMWVRNLSSCVNLAVEMLQPGPFSQCILSGPFGLRNVPFSPSLKCHIGLYWLQQNQDGKSMIAVGPSRHGPGVRAIDAMGIECLFRLAE
jgi:hypothetical protein